MQNPYIEVDWLYLLASTRLQLPPKYNYCAIASQIMLHFTLCNVAMHIIRSWIVHLTLIQSLLPVSNFAEGFITMCS